MDPSRGCSRASNHSGLRRFLSGIWGRIRAGLRTSVSDLVKVPRSHSAWGTHTDWSTSARTRCRDAFWRSRSPSCEWCSSCRLGRFLSNTTGFWAPHQPDNSISSYSWWFWELLLPCFCDRNIWLQFRTNLCPGMSITRSDTRCGPSPWRCSCLWGRRNRSWDLPPSCHLLYPTTYSSRSAASLASRRCFEEWLWPSSHPPRSSRRAGSQVFLSFHILWDVYRIT